MMIERISSRVSPAVAITAAAVLSAAAILLDFLTPAHFNPSILYVPALVMVAMARSRKLLWTAMILFVFLTFFGLVWDSEPGAGIKRFNYYATMNRAMVILDRKSTRLNSSHLVISYAVFCLKKNIS